MNDHRFIVRKSLHCFDGDASVPQPDDDGLQGEICTQVQHRKGLGFTSGGNYRSGRQARWRIVVTDDAGKVVPVKRLNGIAMGGGVAEDCEHLVTESAIIGFWDHYRSLLNIT